MITSKQRAYLRSLANKTETIFQVGKGGVQDALIAGVNDALLAREIVKLKVLETSPTAVRQVAEDIANKSGADVVQVIGSRFTLYKANPKEPVIVLPK